MRYNIIFVVGTPRSGTTLLQQELFSHTDSDSFFETHFFSNLNYYNIFRLRFYRKKKICSSVLADLYDDSRFLNMERNLGRSFFDVIKARLEEKGRRIFIEKTPAHLYHILPIIDACPNDVDLNFVHIVRPKYENVRSLFFASNEHSKSWGGTRSISSCSKRWDRDLKIHHNFLGRRSHHFIDYESLVFNKRKVVEAACRSLNIDFLENGRKVDLNEIIAPSELWKKNNFKDIGEVNNYQFISREKFYLAYRISQEIEVKCSEILSGCL